MYDIKDATWTWLNGEKETGHGVSYGTIGIPNAENQPGSRIATRLLFDADANAIHLCSGHHVQNISCMLNTGSFLVLYR